MHLTPVSLRVECPGRRVSGSNCVFPAHETQGSSQSAFRLWSSYYISYVLRGIRRRQHRHLLSPEKEKHNRRGVRSVTPDLHISPGVGRGPDLGDVRHGVGVGLRGRELERGNSVRLWGSQRGAGLMSIHLHLLLLLVCECPFSADQGRVRLKEEV